MLRAIVSLALAGAAVATVLSTGVVEEMDVAARQRVSVDAASLAGVPSGEVVSSQYVRPHRDGLKVGWVHTAFDSAEMVNRQADGDGPNVVFINPSRGPAGAFLSLPGGKPSVAILVKSSGPQMASRFGVEDNLFTEAINGWPWGAARAWHRW